jgi:hypothetical protein
VNDRQHSLDCFTQSFAAQFAAFVWGLAEATVFFIVPDVLLSMLGCRSIHAGIKASGYALLGALLGGLIMCVAGRTSPENLHGILIHVPAIHPQLVERVQSQLSEYHLGAVLIGPITGIPYKIYAVEWGAHHGDIIEFLLVSIPARGVRFLIAVFLASGISRLIAPWTKQRAKIEMGILALFWIGFYTFYFVHFGW